MIIFSHDMVVVTPVIVPLEGGDRMVKKLSQCNGALVLVAWKKLSHGNGVFGFVKKLSYGNGALVHKAWKLISPPQYGKTNLVLSVIRDVGLTYLRSYAILQFLGTNMAFIRIVVCFANVTCFQCF